MDRSAPRDIRPSGYFPQRQGVFAWITGNPRLFSSQTLHSEVRSRSLACIQLSETVGKLLANRCSPHVVQVKQLSDLENRTASALVTVNPLVEGITVGE